MPLPNPYGLTEEDRIKLASLPKLHFAMSSVATIAAGKDPDNPNYVLSPVLLPTSSPEFELIQGANLDYWVKYNGLEPIPAMTGLVSWQMDNGTGGAAQINLWSDRTNDDGVTFTPNDFSLRDSEISNTAASSQSKDSAVSNWMPGEAIRFAFFNDAGGNLTLDAPSQTVYTSELVTGFSFFWRMQEP